MKLAKIFWSLGSLLINVTIIIYIALSSKAPQDIVERYAYINSNWALYGAHWKAEFLFMTLIAIGAVFFAARFRKISWSVIVVGQLILLLTYPIMLGGYQNTPFELAEMANQMATVVFVFGNLVFFSGLLLLYREDGLLKKWLRIVAMGLSGIGALVFLITFAGVISWKQAMMAGPLINILYLINAYYGLKIGADEK
ncbi:hypothetical protein [Lentiprolixibacter aurantiacus]|uniref:DUF998 domain-containing protein n=1 Tax=Lentiprolixibacter aurantiacus TaxID=2993939 RepID=A0AAE3SM66_9FLAO|nr:hypothetical protein [Lentiprolixibacter aurantiacus]MCX2718125.1 hypothetical protein [Lentiprolixibacter aurantiacus]